MARTANTIFEYLKSHQQFRYRAGIYEGDNDDHIEGLCRNVNYLFNEMAPFLINHVCNQDSANGRGYTGTTTFVASRKDAPFCFRSRIVKDLSYIRWYFYGRTDKASGTRAVKVWNRSGSSATSDNFSTTFGRTTLSLAYDSSQPADSGYEQFYLDVCHTDSGNTYLKTIQARIKELSGALPASSSSIYDSDYIPLDDNEWSQYDPLTVDLARTLDQNLYELWRDRIGNILAWGDESPAYSGRQMVQTMGDGGTYQDHDGGGTYHLITEIPYQVLPGMTNLRLHANCTVDNAAYTGTICLRNSIDSDKTTFNNADGAWSDWDDGWVTSLSVAVPTGQPWDTLQVLWKADNSVASLKLYSLSIWAEDYSL